MSNERPEVAPRVSRRKFGQVPVGISAAAERSLATSVPGSAASAGPAAPPRPEDGGTLVEAGELLVAELAPPLRAGPTGAVDAHEAACRIACDDGSACVQRAAG